MDQIAEAVEQLRCAEVNCDNIAKAGPVFITIVKRQIQTAITFLGAEPVGGYDWQKETGDDGTDRDGNRGATASGAALRSSDEGVRPAGADAAGEPFDLA